ncbi:MAG: hypothetical protein OFPII_29980 [Osedax symbiont Rs1]|nr:MAG: hypothetical protein OFPII_29980 [Osedax symbiont Rs1]
MFLFEIKKTKKPYLFKLMELNLQINMVPVSKYCQRFAHERVKRVRAL